MLNHRAQRALAPRVLASLAVTIAGSVSMICFCSYRVSGVQVPCGQLHTGINY